MRLQGAAFFEKLVMRTSYPMLLIFLDLNTIISGARYKIWSSSLCNFPSPLF